MHGFKANINYILIINLLITSIIFGAEFEKKYLTGIEAYHAGQFNLAIQKFENILNSEWESEQLYYNLGNAYYRDDNIAGAIWAFEQCLILNPNHRDALYNLKLANLKVADRVDFPEPPFYLKYYRTIKQWFTPVEWIFYFFGALLIFAVLKATRKIFNFTSIRKIEGLLTVILIAIALIGLHSIWDHHSTNEGIVYEKLVSAYSAPNQNSTKLFEVHEGLKVSILNINNDWIEIELIDGKSGWINSNKLRLIRG